MFEFSRLASLTMKDKNLMWWFDLPSKFLFQMDFNSTVERSGSRSAILISWRSRSDRCERHFMGYSSGWMTFVIPNEMRNLFQNHLLRMKLFPPRTWREKRCTHKGYTDYLRHDKKYIYQFFTLSFHHQRSTVTEIRSSSHGENISLIAKEFMMIFDSDSMLRDNSIGSSTVLIVLLQMRKSIPSFTMLIHFLEILDSRPMTRRRSSDSGDTLSYAKGRKQERSCSYFQWMERGILLLGHRERNELKRNEAWRSRNFRILDCFTPQGNFSPRFTRIHLFLRNDKYKSFSQKWFDNWPKNTKASHRSIFSKTQDEPILSREIPYSSSDLRVSPKSSSDSPSSYSQSQSSRWTLSVQRSSTQQL